MPGFDRTGPRGFGSMTGGGRGLCNPQFGGIRAPFTGDPNYNPYGQGFGYGNPYGQGVGYGYGMGSYPPYAGNPYAGYPYAPYQNVPYSPFGGGRGFGRGFGGGRGMGRGWRGGRGMDRGFY